MTPIGLKRGTVALAPHNNEWERMAEDTIRLLREILGTVAMDIQHIGSTAIKEILAKPIIDIVIGVQELNDIMPFVEPLREHGIIFRGEDVRGQILFVMGDFNQDTRTHHIHTVKYNGEDWNNYLNLRDYLNSFAEKAKEYSQLKQNLMKRYANDRVAYTNAKQTFIEKMLTEARAWRNANN